MAFDKAKLSEIYKKVLANTTPQPQNKDDIVLIVDGMNNFLRCWAGSPIVDDNGIPNGGLKELINQCTRPQHEMLCRPTILLTGDGGAMKNAYHYYIAVKVKES